MSQKKNASIPQPNSIEFRILAEIARLENEGREIEEEISTRIEKMTKIVQGHNEAMNSLNERRTAVNATLSVLRSLVPEPLALPESTLEQT
jgi:hypothetical protein